MCKVGTLESLRPDQKPKIRAGAGKTHPAEARRSEVSGGAGKVQTNGEARSLKRLIEAGVAADIGVSVMRPNICAESGEDSMVISIRRGWR